MKKKLNPDYNATELRSRMLATTGRLMRRTATMLGMLGDALDRDKPEDVQESIYRMANEFERIADQYGTTGLPTDRD
jgi:hypothetical protein